VQSGARVHAHRASREVWPTPNEVAANIPTINGWDTAIENAPGEGGPLLAGLSLGAFDLPEERRRQCLDLIFEGMIGLWDAPGRTGFICRGFLEDRKSFYPQTSWDQVPPHLAGLWLYFRSAYCTEERSTTVAEVFDSVLRWIEGNGWAVAVYDGRPCAHGAIGESEDPGVARLLAVLLMAHEVTGDAHWRDAYVALRDEDDPRRFDCIAAREKVWQPYTSFYQTFFLWALEQLDDDEECRAFYARERRQFLFHLSSFTCRHIYAQFTPIGTGEGKTINVREDRLIDWRPAYEAAKRDPTAGDPEKPRFWYNYRTRLEQMRADMGPNNDGWLTYDFFTLLGAFALAQGRPSKWAYARPAACLTAFFRRLSFDRALRFLPKLAFALGVRDLLERSATLSPESPDLPRRRITAPRCAGPARPFRPRSVSGRTPRYSPGTPRGGRRPRERRCSSAGSLRRPAQSAVR